MHRHLPKLTVNHFYDDEKFDPIEPHPQLHSYNSNTMASVHRLYGNVASEVASASPPFTELGAGPGEGKFSGRRFMGPGIVGNILGMIFRNLASILSTVK